MDSKQVVEIVQEIADATRECEKTCDAVKVAEQALTAANECERKSKRLVEAARKKLETVIEAAAKKPPAPEVAAAPVESEAPKPADDEPKDEPKIEAPKPHKHGRK